MKKKIISIVTAAALALTALFSMTGVEAQAKVSASKVKKAYAAYVKKNIANDPYAIPGTSYYLYDFNKDGIKEMVVCEPGGARGTETVYSYYNGKVVESYKYYFNSVGYIKGKKYVVGYGSGGYQDFDYTVYKISKGKLKQQYKYACVAGVFKKNGKKISKKAFMKFEKTVITSFSAKAHSISVKK